MLVEAVKKLNEAENTVKTLRQKLCANKSGEDNFSWIEHQMEQFVENDLQCNICYEMFIKVMLIIEIIKQQFNQVLTILISYK